MLKYIIGGCFFALIMVVGTANAAYFAVNDTTGNWSMKRAFNLDSKFDQNSYNSKTNPDKSATNPWSRNTKFHTASVEAATAVKSNRDWYSFSIDKTKVKAFFDIDYTKKGLGSSIALYDASGKYIAYNGEGELNDVGSSDLNNPWDSHPWDSFMNLTLDTGRYFLSIGGRNNSGMLAGQGYTLHVGLNSLSNPAAGGQISETPIPAGIWLFGSAMLMLTSGLRRKNKT